MITLTDYPFHIRVRVTVCPVPNLEQASHVTRPFVKVLGRDLEPHPRTEHARRVRTSSVENLVFHLTFRHASANTSSSASWRRCARRTRPASPRRSPEEYLSHARWLTLASAPPLNTQPQLSDEEIMRQQEEKMKAKYGNLKPKKKLIHKVRARAAPERIPNHPARPSLNRSEPVATPLAGCQVLRLRGLRPSARAGTFSAPIPSPRLLPAARLSIIAAHAVAALSPPISQEDPEHPIDAQEDVGNLPAKISSSPPKKK
jgi:hypothetical protein